MFGYFSLDSIVEIIFITCRGFASSSIILCSVADPFHFDMDPDPDPRIRFLK